MATSICAEITSAYFAELCQYFEAFYNKVPSETEKATIQEAAQLCNFNNSEEDYINIYARLHGVDRKSVG